MKIESLSLNFDSKLRNFKTLKVKSQNVDCNNIGVKSRNVESVSHNLDFPPSTFIFIIPNFSLIFKHFGFPLQHMDRRVSPESRNTTLVYIKVYYHPTPVKFR